MGNKFVWGFLLCFALCALAFLLPGADAAQRPKFLRTGLKPPSSFLQASSTGRQEVDPNSWDYLLLVQQWSPGVCLTDTRPCIIPTYVDYWTIHGLWANRYDGSYPAFCNPKDPFELRDVASIENQLNDYWPSLYSTNATSFWAHEWEKHGTCSATLPSLSTTLRYFVQTLKLRDKYNLSETFKARGITPSGSGRYSRDQLEEAIHDAFGVQPVLACKNGRKGGEEGPVLIEIGLCINKELQVSTCPQSIIDKGFGGLCSRQNKILYPPFPN
jgi:ribonuclease T2